MPGEELRKLIENANNRSLADRLLLRLELLGLDLRPEHFQRVRAMSDEELKRVFVVVEHPDFRASSHEV